MRRAMLVAALLLWGCASPNPRYHALERVAGPVLPAPARVVIVRAVAMPLYLERDEIVRLTEGGRVHVAENDWWSERLGRMISRVLAADLSQRLPGEQVLGTEALGGEGATVMLAVDRFEPIGGNVLALDGHLSVEIGDKDRVLRKVAIQIPLTGGGIDGQVDAMSQALAAVADMAAAELARR